MSGICHAAGRALLQQKKELILNNDFKQTTTQYQYTTTGWMMWNWMIAGLSCGSRIVLFDGSPLYPKASSQLNLIRRQNVTNWGTSPKFLAALRHEGISKLDQTTLRSVGAVGSPLNPDLYYWFYSIFPKQVGLFSGSGGTDLVGGIVGSTSWHSVYPGEISSATVGMKVEIWDQDGKDITSTGEAGELVITKPFFSMPLSFWGDLEHKKYKKAYFEEFEGVWAHGDLIRKNTVTGGYEILGRSDGVLNPGGVRFGTAELYRLLDGFDEIEDCIAVGQRSPLTSDERVFLFLKLKKGKLEPKLRKAIEAKIKSSLSSRHVPNEIIQVKDIPYTVNGKKVEKTVRDIVSSRKSQLSPTIANPECLIEYENYALKLPRQEKL